MTTPWQTAPPITRGLKGYIGCLALVVVGGYHERVDTGFGVNDKGGVRVSVVILDGKEAGEVLEDQVLTATRLVTRLRSMSGGVALGRIVGEPLPGDKLILDLADPTPADQQLAAGWHAAFPGRLDGLVKTTVAAWEQAEAKGRRPAAPAAPPSWSPNTTSAPTTMPTTTWSTAAPPQSAWGQQAPTAPPWGATPSDPTAPPY